MPAGNNILFVVMEFVPLNLGGVFRPLRFVNGLKKNNINPVVVTFEDLMQISGKSKADSTMT